MQHNNVSAWNRFKNRVRSGISAVTPGQAVLKASGTGILIASLLFFALTLADLLLRKQVGFGYYLLTLLIRAVPVLLLACLISWIVYLLAKTPRAFRIALAFTYCCIFCLYKLNDAASWTVVIMLVLFPALIFGAIAYRRKHRRAALSRKKQVASIVFLAIGAVGAILGLYFFLYPGSPVKPLTNYAMSGALPAQISAPDPSKPGPHPVSFLTYGSGTDKRRKMYREDVQIKTPSVDASFLLKPWGGFYGKLRKWYFGFDQTALPLNGMVWYPKDLQGPAPLVLVVHGNHLAQDWSEKGYDYLAELLASRGYIVASVDENFMNTSFTDQPWGGLKNENGTRGWLMLKHLELWRKWNEDPKNPFFHRIDMNNVALMGHSRGGEAMSHAALFNRLPYFPDNANEKFDFNFNIKAYVAIAPVDAQYKPASIEAPLKDINYFVIHGTHDMDMQSYGGLAPYQRIGYSPSYTGFKAGLYIHRANHGQFSSSWGKYDGSSPYANLYNITNLMQAKDQAQIAKVYISAFLDLHLKGAAAYKPLFVDYRYGREWLPKQIYFSQFQDSKTSFIARYEEDLDLQTTGTPGVAISTANLSVWREALHKLMWNDHISRAAYIGWNREGADTLAGSYTFTLPDSTGLTLSGQSLVFTLAESDESSAHVKKGKQAEKKAGAEKQSAKKTEENSGEKKAIDFTIELTDQAGAQIRFPLSACMPLQPQIKKHLTKFAYLNANDDAESIPDLFHFDLDELQQQHPAFIMNKLRNIRFIFDRSPAGVIILDDVGFANLK